MPFKDLPIGTTHSFNDGCGEKEHNSKQKPCFHCKKLHETDSTGMSICEECRKEHLPPQDKRKKNNNTDEVRIPQWPPIIDRKAVICPVCNGEGHHHQETDSTCIGCSGRGWIVI